MIGIYQIKNKENGKVYIGKSINIEKRWKRHMYCLKNNKKGVSEHLQYAWNKDGEGSFEFFILKECEEEELKYWEEYYINLYESYDSKKGYNIERISNGVEHHSEETKRKISRNITGDKNPNYGRKFSIEHRKKLSFSKFGEKHFNYGKHLSIEHRKKISISHLGENNPNSKLTWDKVKEIRMKYIPRIYTQHMLSKEYGVNQSTIKDILINKIWREEIYD